MTGNIRLFRKNALREAFIAGQKSALADTSNFQDIFTAGEKKGSAFLNEAVNAPSFMEIMSKRNSESPGDFKSWMNQNEDRLYIPIVKDRFTKENEEQDVILVKGSKEVTLGAIEEAVAAAYGVAVSDLNTSKRRLRAIKVPRHVCYYMAYFHSKAILEDIGQRWGDRDHATVIHGAKVVSRDVTSYKTDREKLIDVYIHLIKGGYNTDVMENEVEGSVTRTIVEYVKLDI